MPDSTHVTIKNFNHVSVPRDTIVIVPAQAPTIIVNSVDYSAPAWGFILVLLVISMLFYYKKTYISLQHGPTKPTPAIKEDFDPTCGPDVNNIESFSNIKIYSGSPKLKFDEPTDVSLPAETINMRKS